MVKIFISRLVNDICYIPVVDHDKSFWMQQSTVSFLFSNGETSKQNSVVFQVSLIKTKFSFSGMMEN